MTETTINGTPVLGVPAVTPAFPGIDRLGTDCRIAKSVTVYRLVRTNNDENRGIICGNRVSLYEHVRLVLGDPNQHPKTRLAIGNDVIVNVFCYLSGEGGLTIGDQVLIGSHVKLLSAGHSIDGEQASVWHNSLTYAPVSVNRGAWIAAGATVLPGTTIGRGAVVGAGSVVTRDVPDFAVVAGNPARLVRYRKGYQPKRRFWYRRS